MGLIVIQGFSCPMEYRIWVPRPGIESESFALEGRFLTTGSPDKSLLFLFSDLLNGWESLGQKGDQTGQSYRKSTLNIHWKGWCWSSNTLATWCEELTHWKRPWFWERLKAGREGNDSGWDGWMASPTWRTWVWTNFGSLWRTGKPGVLQSMGSQRAGVSNWTTATKKMRVTSFMQIHSRKS